MAHFFLFWFCMDCCLRTNSRKTRYCVHYALSKSRQLADRRQTNIWSVFHVVAAQEKSGRTVNPPKTVKATVFPPMVAPQLPRLALDPHVDEIDPKNATRVPRKYKSYLFAYFIWTPNHSHPRLPSGVSKTRKINASMSGRLSLFTFGLSRLLWKLVL